MNETPSRILVVDDDVLLVWEYWDVVCGRTEMTAGSGDGVKLRFV